MIAPLIASFLQTPLQFWEGACSYLAGGVKAAIHHAHFFQVLASALPTCIPIVASAVQQLVGDVDPAAAATTRHDAATLQARCAVAGAWLGGTLRSLSASSDGSPDAPAAATQALVVEALRPLLTHVNVAWIGEVSNMLRFAARGRHPSRLEPVYKAIFHGAASHLADAAADAPAPLDDGVAAWHAAVTAVAAGGSDVAADAGASRRDSTAAAVSGVAVQRWVRYAGALLEEAAAVSAAAEGDGAAGWAAGSDTTALPPLRATITTSPRAAAAAWARSCLLSPLLRCLTHPFEAVRSVSATTLGLLAENGSFGDDGSWDWAEGALHPPSPSAAWLRLLTHLRTAAVHSVLADGAAGLPSPAQRALDSLLSLTITIAPTPSSLALPVALVTLPAAIAAASHADAAVAGKAGLALRAVTNCVPTHHDALAVIAAVDAGIRALESPSHEGARSAATKTDHASRAEAAVVVGCMLASSAAFGGPPAAGSAGAGGGVVSATPNRMPAVTRLCAWLDDSHQSVQVSDICASPPPPHLPTPHTAFPVSV